MTTTTSLLTEYAEADAALGRSVEGFHADSQMGIMPPATVQEKEEELDDLLVTVEQATALIEQSLTDELTPEQGVLHTVRALLCPQPCG